MLKVKIDKRSERTLRTQRLKAEVLFSSIDVIHFLYTHNQKITRRFLSVYIIVVNLTIIFFYFSFMFRVIGVSEDKVPFSLLICLEITSPIQS